VTHRTRKKNIDAPTVRHDETLVALHQIGLELGSRLDMSQLLPEIITQAIELLQTKPGGGGVTLLDEATGELEIVFAVGSGANSVGGRFKPGEGMAGRVLVSGKALTVDDYSAWEGRVPEHVRAPREAVLVVPLRWRDQIIGTLGIETTQAGRVFNQDDVRLAELFAAQAALAISNARLYERERDGHKRMEAMLQASSALSSSLSLSEVLSLVLQSCKVVLPFVTASIMTFEGGVPTMAALSGYEGQEDEIIQRTKADLKLSRIIERMMKDLQPIIIDDVREHPDWIRLPSGEHIRAWLGLPLVARHELIGALMLDSDQVGAYKPEHVEVGQLLASQATIALENAHLFSAMESALTQIEAYFKASEAIISAADATSLLAIIAGPAMKDVSGCKAYLFYAEQRAEGDPTWLELAARLGQGEVTRLRIGQRFNVDEFPLMRLLWGRPFGVTAVSDTYAPHPLLDDQTAKALQAFNARALTIIPLKIGHRWIGAVALTWPEAHPITVSEEQFYTIIAPQLAAVVDNRRLLYETQQAQERFHDMALSTSDWLWEADDQGRITFCSERVSDVTGYAASEIVGKTPFDFMPDRDARRLRIVMARAAQDQEPLVDVVQWLRHKDGHPVCQSVSAVPILNSEGRLMGYRGVSKDITEQSRAEQRERLAFELGQKLTAVLSVAEICKTIVSRLAATFGYYHVSIWLYDESQNALITRREYGGVTLTAADTLAYKLDSRPGLVAQAGRTRQAVISNDTAHDPEFKPVSRLPDTRAEVVMPLVHGEQLLGALNVESSEAGYFNPAETRLLQNLAAQISVAMANAHLYEQLEAQANNLEQLVRERTGEVLTERERLQSIVEHASEGIFFTRADGIVEYVNPAWQRITGLHSREIVGKRLSDIIDEQATQGLNQMLGSFQPGASWEGEIHNRRPDGSEYDALLRIVPAPDARGRIGNLVGVMHDISARKQIDRMRSKFVANVSHELRTPITNLKLYQTLIANASGDRLAEYISTMGDQVNRLERLVEDLLDVSRLDRGSLEMQPEMLDLNQLLRESVESQRLRAERRSQSLSVVLLPDLPPIYVDQKRMSQVATNLLANAINYTPQGENIGVRSWLERRDPTEWVAFSVWDTGTGIAPEDLPFIFEPFFRSEQAKQSGMPGTGLGLGIVKEIIELHQGRINVESVPGKGTSFTVWLPAYAAPGK